MYRVAVLLAISAVLSAGADRARTSDLLIVSGGRAVRKWKYSDERWNGNQRVYAGSDTFTLTPRKKPSPETKINIVIWIRGVPEADLFIYDPKGPPPASTMACGQERRSSLNLDVATEAMVGYGVCFAVDHFDKAQGEIVVIAN